MMLSPDAQAEVKHRCMMLRLMATILHGAQVEEDDLTDSHLA
jgi:hypothetical protein